MVDAVIAKGSIGWIKVSNRIVLSIGSERRCFVIIERVLEWI